MTSKFEPPRVAQFVPGDNPKALLSTLDPARAVDQWIINWEAAIVDKEAARRTTFEFLAASRPASETIVRVNGRNTPWGKEDVFALLQNAGKSIDGILVPLVQSADDVAWWWDEMYRWRRTLHLDHITHRLHVLVETPLGVMNAKEIGIALAGTGCAGNMKAGLADYTTAVGAWETAEDPETNFSLFLQTVATVANSYGLHAIGPTPPNVEADTEAWGNMCRKMGYSGIMTIHPKQRDGAIRAFTPKPERIARAIKRLDALEQSGGAAVRLADGSVIEVPMCGPDFTVLKAAARAGLIDASSITRYSKLFQ